MRARQRGESALLLLDAIDAIADAEVAYAVIGAMAASVHGVVRASLDADAVLAISTRELPDLERALRRRGFVTELRYGDADDCLYRLLPVVVQAAIRKYS
jgi:hypothetical protein